MSEIASMDKADIFLQEEERLLNKTLRIREQIVDEILKDGVPMKTSMIRVTNELLNSIDNQILGKVDKRLKSDQNQNDKNILEAIKELVINKKLNVPEVKRDTMPEVDIELSDDDIVEGEDVIEYKELSLEDLKGE